MEHGSESVGQTVSFVRMQAPSNKLDAARGSGRRFLSRHARATDAEQMMFFLKIHNSKLLKTKKAVSS
jgi:hypothetical protein